MSRDKDFLSVIDMILSGPRRSAQVDTTPEAQRRWVGAQAAARPQYHVPIKGTDMHIGVDVADYSNGGLP